MSEERIYLIMYAGMQFEVNKGVYEAFNQLQQENKQLKEKISKINSDNQNLYGENNVLKIRDKNITEQKDLYKTAFDEIREYIKSESPDAGVSGHRILQIIDKALGDDGK